MTTWWSRAPSTWIPSESATSAPARCWPEKCWRSASRTDPDGLSLYRGNCVLHRAELTRNGITIWGQPDARAHHAPPLPKDFVWRYLLIGRDKVLLKRLIRDRNVTLPKKRMTDKLYARLVSICRYYPAKLLWLPVAVPIVLVATSLILAGYWVTRTQAGLLIRLYESLEQKAGEI